MSPLPEDGARGWDLLGIVLAAVAIAGAALLIIDVLSAGA